MHYILPSIRLCLATMLICVAGYCTAVFAFAQLAAPWRAAGSLIERDGRVVGSTLVGQQFASARYFWPRPSAVDYNAMAAAGSNLSPTSEDLTQRAGETVARYGATAQNPLPADLVAASGGGLDPHISLAGALYQVDRVAAARQIDGTRLRRLVRQQAQAPGGLLAPGPIVNVLQLNLALDRLAQ